MSDKVLHIHIISPDSDISPFLRKYGHICEICGTEILCWKREPKTLMGKLRACFGKIYYNNNFGGLIHGGVRCDDIQCILKPSNK